MKSIFTLALAVLGTSASAAPASGEDQRMIKARAEVALYSKFTAPLVGVTRQCNNIGFKSEGTGNIRPLTYVLAQSSKIAASARSGTLKLSDTNSWVLQTVTNRNVRDRAVFEFQLKVLQGQTFEVFGFFPNGTGKYLGNKVKVAQGSSTCLAVPTCSATQYYDPEVNLCYECRGKFRNARTCTIAGPTSCTYGKVTGNRCLPAVCTGETYLSSSGASCLTCSTGTYLNVQKTGCTTCPGGLNACKIFSVPFAGGNVRCIGGDATSCLGPSGRIECPPTLAKNSDGSCIAGKATAFYPNTALLSLLPGGMDVGTTSVMSECHDLYPVKDTAWTTTSVLGSVLGLVNLCTAYRGLNTATFLPSPVSAAMVAGTCQSPFGLPGAILGGPPSACQDTIYVENALGSQSGCYTQSGSGLIPCPF